MTMTFQAHDGHGARSEDLHRHILRSHLAYLNQEETPAKLEQRRNLESLISEFLCVVSHGAKFTFLEVANILDHSIKNNLNFRAYKAASAFEALEKYATNLISHPWRKEYKTVKLYSGFYKHSVENQLIGGSSVFHLLGYKYTEDGVLHLDEPVDPDRVARVALDCLIAYVECQVMIQVCERVKSFKCSWLDIHSIREDYVCGIDESVRILHQLKRNAVEQEKQDRWLRDQENGSMREEKALAKPESAKNYAKTGILVDVSNTWPSNSSFPGYSENSLILQPSVIGGSYTNKASKSTVPTHSKLPSWSEGVSSEITDFQGRNFISRSDETESYGSRSFDDHIQPNYSFLNKCNNPVTGYEASDLTSENWKDSWDMLHSSLQPSPYHSRNDSYINCDHDSHRTGYTNTVPNVKETYTSHFGHIYPSHPMMSVGVPAYPYPLPHEYTVNNRQCQCRMCCEHQVSVISNKYQHPKDISSNFESNRSTRIDINNLDDANDVCSSFLKMSVDNPNQSLKSRHFPVSSPSYSSYQTSADIANDVTLRPSAGNKSQQNACKRGSYYDNVPSPFDDGNSPFTLAGQSLNTKCDFQSNGIVTCNVPTLCTKSKIQKGAIGSDSVGNCSSLKPQLKKSYSNSSSTNSVIAIPEITPLTGHSESKNLKSHLPLVHKDSKNSKKWSCTSCTYYNAAETSICDMCGRSKHPGPEITPLVSGGRECPQCTLVNKKDSEDCTACGTSLKDSPTYI